MSAPRSTTLRILHVVPTYAPAWRYGGPIHAVHGLCRGLAQLGHDVHVFTTSVDGPDDLDVPLATPVDRDGVKVSYFACARLRRLYRSEALGTALDARVRDFDAVHLHSVFLWPTWKAARAARRVGRPWVLSPRGMLVPELIAARSRFVKALWIRCIERANLEGAAFIHATSDIEADGIRRCHLDLAPIRVVPNGVDVVEKGEAARDPHDLLFVGRISWKKNLPVLIEALAALPQCRLTIAGPDDENLVPVLRDRAAAAGVADRIRWLGAIDAASRDALLARSACLVLPSINENFGNVVVEAMAAGCPVVVAPGVGAKELVREAGAGLVASDNTADTFASAIRRVLSDGAAAAEMSDRARAYVAENLAWSHVAERMTALYADAIARNGGRRAA